MALDLRLDDPAWIPEPLARELVRHADLLQSCEFTESLLEHGAIRGVAVRLEEFIRQNNVVGYHCTREDEPGYLCSYGLRVLDREAHQAELLARHASRFSLEELQAVQSAWSSYFPGLQDQGRNKKLWFCLSVHQVVHGATDRFFEYFGGEAVHMPLDGLPTVLAKLRAIGRPVVVEVRIDPAELTTFKTLALARDALSHHHRSINPSAYPDECEAYLSRDVRPGEVLAVTPKDVFFAEHAGK